METGSRALRARLRRMPEDNPSRRRDRPSDAGSPPRGPDRRHGFDVDRRRSRRWTAMDRDRGRPFARRHDRADPPRPYARHASLASGVAPTFPSGAVHDARVTRPRRARPHVPYGEPIVRPPGTKETPAMSTFGVASTNLGRAGDDRWTALRRRRALAG